MPLDNTNSLYSTFLELGHHPQARYSDFASLIITIQIDAERAIFDIPDSGTQPRAADERGRVDRLVPILALVCAVTHLVDEDMRGSARLSA